MRLRTVLAGGLALGLLSSTGFAQTGGAGGHAGLWEISSPTTAFRCRVQLRQQRSDKGDLFLSVPTACRHAMPVLAMLGRWAEPDATHIVLEDPTGAALLLLADDGDGFAGVADGEPFRLRPVALGTTAALSDLPEEARSVKVLAEAPPGGRLMGPAESRVEPAPARFIPIAHRPKEASETERVSDLAGRYAVMRDKRDTGCMVTLDATRGKVGERAQLAPGCRDQGIVIFDPSSWQIVRGDLVLTARAGHKAKLLKQDDGSWQKDPKEGGKPLGLKKL